MVVDHHAFQRVVESLVLGLRSVGTPRISIVPAGYRINRGLSEARLGYRDGLPNWGPRDPG